jgi:flagellar L-ring protein precursor FlgH
MNELRLRSLVLALFACAPLVSAWAQEPEITGSRSFYADRRANAPGDALTVIITEFSTVQATAQTSTNKAESARASILQPDTITQSVGADFDSNFAGGGQIERSGKLIAKLAVTVTGVDARGNLLVEGQQEIQVNNERQRISLTGVVRPEDIGPDNTIASWRVSGAHIEFTGKGLLAKKQSPGILTRILSWIWE